ncbi:DUF1573 domain-containing protein [Runella aurantiaca]|uniref:DUF1573 domain-containing protein n=1 Tax=Runella aurantiaca TaxID=2282308 RepID=A0A369ICM6_9BACT|nr:DUF1573 domain-containing protein [Runella aurantiaca]RDB04964.1 DUF1573 domain-containing protein [Runella aurantiaca]
MRYLFLALVSTVLLSCGSNQDKNATSNLDDKLPKFEFAEDIKNVDFGSLKEGAQVEHTFKFKNVGDFPLIINNVSASCGCTIPEWPRQPIGPGDEGAILVRFNSKGKQGQQFKTVTIFANTNPATTDIQFKADVEAAKDSVTTSSL